VSKEVEPNDAFLAAATALFDPQNRAQLEGTVSQVGDLDVFTLGAREPGDRLVIDAKTPNSSLDVSIAVFDGDGRLVAENDDHVLGAQLDSFLDLTVRHAADPYYVAISHSAFGASNMLRGTYRIDVEFTAGARVPDPVGQRLLLDFDGAVVNSPFLGNFTLPVFDAGDIAAVYEGETEAIKERIREVFAQNYERFNVTIFTTDDAALPAEPYSAIFFGGFDPRAFGLAENVDLYNVDLCDDAVIFAESFTPDFFRGTPSPEELGTAIGNVGSHEAGHLLGLNHTNDDLDLMDDRSPAQVFLLDQEFMEAPLSSDIMPIGTQDGVLLLLEAVGAVEGSTVMRAVSAKTPEMAVLEMQDGGRIPRRSTIRAVKGEQQRISRHGDSHQ
jgi:hypothetical protein